MKLFPTDEEFGDVHVRHPVPELTMLAQSVVKKFATQHQLSFVELTLGEWLIHLENRMIQARLAFHMMYYYFDLGIPDARASISPGRGGGSVEYLPDFEYDDFQKKAWFNFFADTFAYKLFTAWDSVGQFLNTAYALELEKPSFHTAVKSLRHRGDPIGSALMDLWKRDAFRKFRRIRHDTTHNWLPGQFGGSVTITKGPQEIVMADGSKRVSDMIIAVGVGKYVSSHKIVEIYQGALRVFDETLRVAGLRESGARG